MRLQNKLPEAGRHSILCSNFDNSGVFMEQPQAKSKLIIGGGYFALTFLLALPLSVVVVRSGAWQQGLLLYALSCAAATVVLIMFIILLLLPGFKPSRPDIAKRSFLALPGALLLIAVVSSRGDYPPIHDISTDTQDPPKFSAAVEMRGQNSNPLSVKPESIAAQIQHYPKVETLQNSDTLEINFERAVAVAKSLGWEIYHLDTERGVIEAVQTTAIMGFKDDIVIRLRSHGPRTVIDLRSVSRVGVGDLGANAKRIMAFAQQFNR
jgi:uncharacterized protein (DUF1499 family)